MLGLSITNLTDGFHVSVLLQDDTPTGFYLKDTYCPSSSLRAVSTGEKLVLGTNNALKVHPSADDSDCIVSFVETT